MIRNCPFYFLIRQAVPQQSSGQLGSVSGLHYFSGKYYF